MPKRFDKTNLFLCINKDILKIYSYLNKNKRKKRSEKLKADKNEMMIKWMMYDDVAK